MPAEKNEHEQEKQQQNLQRYLQQQVDPVLLPALKQLAESGQYQEQSADQIRARLVEILLAQSAPPLATHGGAKPSDINAEVFDAVKMAPTDPILGTKTAYAADTHPRKVNLGIGAYRTEEGKPFVLPVVLEAEKEVLAATGAGESKDSVWKEYLPIDGLAELKPLTQRLIFGDSTKFSRVASVQTLSGTGSLRVCAEFIRSQLYPSSSHFKPTIYLSDPTWGNHAAIFAKAGFETQSYPYWDSKTRSIQIDAWISHLHSSPDGSIYLIHPCAHNPTGVDPSPSQWARVVSACRLKDHLVVLDSAYQGYASGDLVKDREAVEMFVRAGATSGGDSERDRDSGGDGSSSSGSGRSGSGGGAGAGDGDGDGDGDGSASRVPMQLFVCQSFAKNLGLYGERVGMLHTVCKDADTAARVLSQMKKVIRPMYSSPPIHGALLVRTILASPAHYAQWEQQLRSMAARIRRMRFALRDRLEEKAKAKAEGNKEEGEGTGTGEGAASLPRGSWAHITDQIGMFSFTGLTPSQCERMREVHHVYLLSSGRISIAGLTSANVAHVADAIDEVVRHARARGDANDADTARR